MCLHCTLNVIKEESILIIFHVWFYFSKHKVLSHTCGKINKPTKYSFQCGSVDQWHWWWIDGWWIDQRAINSEGINHSERMGNKCCVDEERMGRWTRKRRMGVDKWLKCISSFLLFIFNFAVPQKNPVNHRPLDQLFPSNWNAAKRGKYVCFCGQRCPSPKGLRALCAGEEVVTLATKPFSRAL